MSTAARGETWLFDLGNSRLKGARLPDGGLDGVFALDWDHERFAELLAAHLSAWPLPSRVLVASVVSSGRAARLHEALRRFPAAQVAWLRSPRRACGITNSYAVAERFGIDRFLALVAVHARVRGAAVVAGCGTALTLDAIDAQGVHRAGLISASPQLMLAGLRGATAIADSNPDAFDTANGDDTERALRAGCWNAAGALTEWFAAQQRTTLGDAETWLHGGWAPPLAAWLERAGCRARVIGDAVLQGLALWSAAHSENTAVP